MNDGPPGGSSMPAGMPPYFTVGNLARGRFHGDNSYIINPTLKTLTGYSVSAHCLFYTCTLSQSCAYFELK